MPLIYSGRCASCDAVIEYVSDGYCAVYLDEEQEHAHPDDPHLVILAHPLEESILEEHGYKWTQAAWQGRLVSVEDVYCKDCGHGFEIRGINASLFDLSGKGCFSIIALACLMLVGIHFAIENKFLAVLVAYASIVSLWYVLESSIRRIVLWRFPARAKQVATPPECPNCKSRDYASPGALKVPIPCLKCGQRSVSFEVSGMS